MPDETIKARIVFDTAGISGGGFGGIVPTRGAGKGAGGMAGMGGLMGVGKIAAGVAGGMLAATAILGALKKLFTKLVDSFPGLQATMKTFGKAMTLFLRPIAMILDMFLRPMAILLMKFAVQWLKWFQQNQIMQKVQTGAEEFMADPEAKINEWLDFVIKSLEEFDVDAFVQMLGDWFVGIVDALSAVDWETIWDKTTAILILFGQKLFEGLLASIPYIAYGLVKLGEFLFGRLLWVGKTIVGLIIDAWTWIFDKLWGLAEWIWEKITEAFDPLWEKLTELAQWFWDNLIKPIIVAFKKLDEFKKWLWQKLTEPLTKAWEKLSELKDTVWEGVKAAFKTIWDKLAGLAQVVYDKIYDAFKAIWDAIPSWDDIKKGAKKGLSYIGEKAGEGISYLNPFDDFIAQNGRISHFNPQDTVIGMKDPSMMAGQTTINVSLSALDPNSITADVLDKIAHEIEMRIKRRITSASTQNFIR